MRVLGGPVRLKKLFYFIFLFLLVTGFRIFPQGNNWPVDATTNRLWLVPCAGFSPTFSTNDLPASDPLYGQTVTFNQVIDSIANDFTSVPNSWLVVANSSTDGTYNTTIAAQRSIHFCNGSPGGAAGGVARQKRDGSRVTDCEIILADSSISSLKSFVATLTHETGHCIGLDHSQETTHSIMSYYRDRDYTRLQIDDKMGLIYMYPESSDHAAESMTFGLSCAPRN